MRADYADDRAKNGKVLRDPNEDHQSIAGGADEEASIDTSPDSTIPAAFPLLFALTICGAALALCTAVFVMTGSAGRMAATAGFAVGLFAALSAGLRGALIASIGFTCAAGLILAIPVLPVLLAICIALSVLPAVEVALAGTRMAVMVMMGVIPFAFATDRGTIFVRWRWSPSALAGFSCRGSSARDVIPARPAGKPGRGCKAVAPGQ